LFDLRLCHIIIMFDYITDLILLKDMYNFDLWHAILFCPLPIRFKLICINTWIYKKITSNSLYHLKMFASCSVRPWELNCLQTEINVFDVLRQPSWIFNFRLHMAGSTVVPLQWPSSKLGEGSQWNCVSMSSRSRVMFGGIFTPSCSNVKNIGFATQLRLTTLQHDQLVPTVFPKQWHRCACVIHRWKAMSNGLIGGKYIFRADRHLEFSTFDLVLL